MSRIGKKPVEIPKEVTVSVSGGVVRVEGPKGRLELRIPPEVRVATDGNLLKVARVAETKHARAMHGTIRAHLANMVRGVLTPFEKVLEVSGAGFGAKKEGNKLILSLGFTHPIEREIPHGLEVDVPAPVTIVVRGPDRQKVGQFAAELRAIRPQDPYKQKGIRYRDEVVRKKAGKAAVAAAK